MIFDLIQSGDHACHQVVLCQTKSHSTKTTATIALEIDTINYRVNLLWGNPYFLPKKRRRFRIHTGHNSTATAQVP
ncbi:hypothetical protein JZU69_02540, partial [bacterium]|nr:hypothetical protein [bacterium]